MCARLRHRLFVSVCLPLHCCICSQLCIAICSQLQCYTTRATKPAHLRYAVSNINKLASGSHTDTPLLVTAVSGVTLNLTPECLGALIILHTAARGLCTQCSTWAARYNTCHLISLTPKGVVFSLCFIYVLFFAFLVFSFLVFSFPGFLFSVFFSVHRAAAAFCRQLHLAMASEDNPASGK